MVGRNVSESLTSSKALEAQFGVIPSAEELEQRQVYTPAQARNELLALNLMRCTELGLIVESGGHMTFKSIFQKMTKGGVPDLEDNAQSY